MRSRLVACLLLAPAFDAVCAAQDSLPHDLAQLVSIRQKMQDNEVRIPNYTCLETITRSRRPPRSLVVSARGGKGKFLPGDVLRLEVAEVDGSELYAPPGARNFVEKDIALFVTGGMIGNGTFILFARDIFDSRVATYQFAGASGAGGRTLLRYDYQVPLLLSNYQLKCLDTARVGYHGSIWADAKTLETVRVDVEADDIPPAIGVFSSTARIDYAPVRIGSTDVLLPQSAEMNMQVFTGWEDRNSIAFTHCKEYGADSVISYAPPSIDPAAAPPPLKEVEIPPGIVLATRLDTALDSQTTRPGDLVRAHVEADVSHKGTVLVPKDTVVTGRVRLFDRYVARKHYYLVALEFYRFEFPRGPVRFYAAMQKITLPGGAHPAEPIGPGNTLPGVATFTVRGDDLRLAPGARILWKTSRYDQRTAKPR